MGFNDFLKKIGTTEIFNLSQKEPFQTNINLPEHKKKKEKRKNGKNIVDHVHTSPKY